MPDTIYTGARVTTLFAGCPYADSILVRGERIAAVGTRAECLEAARAGHREVGLDGSFVVPGFTDCHIHLAGYARAKRALDLRQAGSLPEAQQALQRYAGALPAGAWVTGGRFDANVWALGRDVHRADLDAYSGDHPVALQNHDGHTTWVNTLALQALGITAESPDPPGGRIERDTDGPTGVLRETAAYPVRAFTDARVDGLDELLADACNDLLAHGVTSIHDIDGRDTSPAYEALRGRGDLAVRVHQLISRSGLDAAIDAGAATGAGDSWLRTGPVKLFSDGALGSHTAALSQPYEDRPDDRGVAVLDLPELTGIARTAARAGIAIAVHAIGDAANHTVLDAVAAVRRGGVGPHLRHRIEHAQHIGWADVGRLASLGVVASMQPIHCTSDVPLVNALLGKRALASYAWADLAAAGARVAFGSDAPVETLDPVAGIQAATTRTGPAGPAVDPSSVVTPLQALRGYTSEAAYASYEEHEKGRLAPGYLADFVALDVDVTDRDVAVSGAAAARFTVVGGEVRWERS